MNIVKLNSSDFAIASEQLSVAFSHDPLMSHFLPEEKAAKLTALKKMCQALLNYAQSYDRIYTTAESPKGVAVWLPPEASELNLSQLWQVVKSGLIALPFYLRWDRIGDSISFLATEIRLHNESATEPHWYLAMLGVLPEFQGKGIGGKLIQPVLQEADRTKMPCYLETSTAAAVRFYQRYGFEIVHQGIFAEREYWTINSQIIEIQTRSGEKIGEEGIAELAQTNSMIAIAEVDQSDIGKVKLGQSAEITGQAFAGIVRGTVDQIGLQVSRQNVFSNQPGENLDRRVVEVKVRLDPEDSKRVAGLTNLQVQTAINTQANGDSSQKSIAN